jgi:Mn-dependent DtxR family transcriptional regulator
VLRRLAIDAAAKSLGYNHTVTQPRNLTANQVLTLTTIRNYQHVHGRAPTVTELARLLDRSRGTTHARIQALTRHGLLRRQPRQHRTLEIIPPPQAKTAAKRVVNAADLITF